MQSHKNVFDLLDENGELYFRIGHASIVKARNALDEHVHENMIEIVLMVKGSQIYKINGQEYKINSSEAFITLPNELHSSGSYPEDKSVIYYLIMNLTCKELSLGFDDEETKAIAREIYGVKQRVLKASPRVRELCDAIMEASCDEKSHKKTILRNLISSFILEIVNCISKEAAKVIPHNLEPVLDYIHENINEDISIEQLARVATLSESRLKASFRKEIGLPPREYILRKKVEMAKAILSDSNKSIIGVSCELGFSSSQYFSTVFKRYTTKTPTEFKKQAKIISD